MKQFTVTGMTCAACSARVEKAVKSVPGVESCAVSLLTHSMGVSGNAEDAAIIKAVENAGYGAKVKGRDAAPSNTQNEDALKDRDTPLLKKRLIASLGFLVILMYLSMGYGMWGWPVPSFLENPMALGLAQLLLSGIILVINQKFFINGFKGLMHRSPNMDTLVALGSGASFGYSIYALFAMAGDMTNAHHYLHEFYFESAAMILALITVGKMLEARSKGKTTDALKSLMKLAPKTATLLKDGQEIIVPIDQVKTGDLFLVKPGENIPVDGVVEEGSSAVNESALTGESIPVDKEKGDAVSAATLNQSGHLTCRATRVGEDTTLSQIIKMVADASATKAPIAKVADQVSGIFVPVVIAIAFVTTIIWLLTGQTFGYALARGISVLVISCPCALGLATPVAIMVGSGKGARQGILFKTAAALEEAGRITIAALDKTGTITQGRPRVTDVLAAEGAAEEELLSLAYSLEVKSEHPLAKAIVEYGKEKNLQPEAAEDFRVLPGNGLSAQIHGMAVKGGSMKFMGAQTEIPHALKTRADQLAGEGKTPLFFAKGGQLLGLIAVADTIKEESAEAIRQLKNMGVKTVMLTGDNERTAQAVGKLAGVDQVIAGVLPDGKEQVIRELKRQGKVLMVGDGINDAPALTRADLGMAIGAGADIAVDAADVVLMHSRLTDVPAAIRLSRATLRNIHENLFWAFIYNIIGIPLAAGAFIALLGWQMNPMFGAAAMSLSSFCVVSNALRLNFLDLSSTKRDHKIKKKKEKKQMEKTMKIEGMMCPHCSGRVKKALEALPQVIEAEVSHETGTAIVKLSAPAEDALLKKTVEDQGYTVIG
ncbi:MAG: heavy metal translocating P-type ATPase [Clostridiales bacterium]|nr:heavy metal translocating P-type ATPase [Clostridiales bacterium]